MELGYENRLIPRSQDEANVFKIHVHDVRSKFASCLLHRVNGL